MIKKIIFIAIFLSLSLSVNAQQDYYNDVDLNLTGLTLKQVLSKKIKATHVKFLNYTPDVWEASKITDANPQNPNEVILIYGWEDGSDQNINNDKYRNNTLQDTGSGASFVWNREHVFSQSLSTPRLNTDDPGPGTDAHNLRPADRNTNSTRSNTRFAEGSGIASGNVSGGWYPGDEWKGDVARMMMYMYLRYDGDGSEISETRCLPTVIGNGSSANTPDDMIDLFLKWNAEDPVSEIERKRNEYHSNTSNSFAQGNRNPFIDNPRLATRIWGGQNAEDTWGIYPTTDTQSPTTPQNLVANNITTFSTNLSWSPSTDNVAVTSYDVYVNNQLFINTTSNTLLLSPLNSNANFSVYVIAKDIANNKSTKSETITFSTIEDTQPPTVPTNLSISNESGNSFVVSWDASTDNTGVTAYEIYVNNTFLNSTSKLSYTLTNLSISTSYNIQILAKDAVNNKSNLSNIIVATTTDGSTTTANELFFSEYMEGDDSNKALEIANVTSSNIDLSSYSIKRNGNGGNSWSTPLNLSGTINANDVFVIINEKLTIQKLIDEADYVHPNNIGNSYGVPISFNGNDPVGLFKNDVLIDIIGVFNSGSANFAKDVTLRRKRGIIRPNTAFDLNNEWDIYPQNTADDFGKHSASLNVVSNKFNFLSIFPNPVKDILSIKFNNKNTQIKKLELINLNGKRVFLTKENFDKINLSKINKGVYILKIQTKTTLLIKKIIKN